MHCVARTLGGKAALTLLDRLMDLANEFLLMRPPCMTAEDILLGAGTPVVRPDARLAKQFARCRDAKVRQVIPVYPFGRVCVDTKY